MTRLRSTLAWRFSWGKHGVTVLRILMVVVLLVSFCSTPCQTQRKRQSKKPYNQFKEAQSAFQNKKYKHAENLLLTYIEEHPKHTKAIFLLGKVYEAKKERGKALEYYLRAFKLNPVGEYAQKIESLARRLRSNRKFPRTGNPNLI